MLAANDHARAYLALAGVGVVNPLHHFSSTGIAVNPLPRTGCAPYPTSPSSPSPLPHPLEVPWFALRRGGSFGIPAQLCYSRLGWVCVIRLMINWLTS